MVQTRAARLAKITVRGIVQGIGFRPFVYRLAKEHGLKGWVRNTSGSVEIEVEGDEKALQSFLNDLKQTPPMAVIESVDVNFFPEKGYTDFVIQESISQEDKYQLISPDIATCNDCKREIFNPGDRRFRYPFTNCTNCGPRFTIIEDIPYDRPNTTMRKFKMCPECQQEYDDPVDRRFHAQPNACPNCGPSLQLVDGDGSPVKCGDIIKSASRLLKEGKVLAIRGLGGFHLACDATNDEVVKLLRNRKRRPSKPFAVMISNMNEVQRHCVVSPEEKRLLESPQCPIVLLKWKQDSSTIASSAAPNLRYLGVMLPYTPLHHLLLRASSVPLVMTSGNLSEEPIAKDNDEALIRLRGIADYFLLHNRDIYARYDDSVIMVEDGQPRLLRRARSYAPYPVFLPFKARQVLACGAGLKNTFCLTRENHAFLGQHIGDLENEETLEHFTGTIELYKKLFRIEPEIIAYDMHPEYLSTKYALQKCGEPGVKPVPVQHHHAHVVSCLVDNKVEAPVIGVAFDGVGYGTDGTIWGGEFLLADLHSFQRLGHLEYVPLVGGAVAIKKPYRMALSYLYSLLGEDFSLKGLPLEKVSRLELDIIKKQLKRVINSPLTSSAGRLFDAVSALVGIRGEIDYEAQAAVELEVVANGDSSETRSYPFAIIKEGDRKIIKLGSLFSAVVRDLRNEVPLARISLKFHNTVAQIIAEMCKLISGETGVKQVALTGGVFQNRLLLKLAVDALKREGLTVLIHHLVPCNDGGISLGQAVIANFTSSQSGV